MTSQHVWASLTALMIIAPAAVAAPAAKMAASNYVKHAGAGDLYEKQSSQLVLETTKDLRVRGFAQMMVSDHSKSTVDVKAAAMKSNLKPQPPALDTKKSSMIADLRAAAGSARDRLYLEQQKAAHQEALTLHQTYAASGDRPALKAAAAKIVPVVQHHIDALAEIKAK
jgi:putative membrane protein